MSPDIVKCPLVHCGFQAHHEPSMDTTGASEEGHVTLWPCDGGSLRTTAQSPFLSPLRSQEKEDMVSAQQQDN